MRVEIIRRDHAARRPLGAVPDAERRAGNFLGDECLDERAVALQIEPVRPRHVGVARRAAVRAGDGEQAILIDDQRIRAQQDALDPAEDRGVGADAEREAEDRQQREARTAQQHPAAEPQVLEQVGEPARARGRRGCLRGCRRAARSARCASAARAAGDPRASRCASSSSSISVEHTIAAQRAGQARPERHPTPSSARG